MQGPLVTSIDAVRWAIADRIRALGGSEQVVDDVAVAAAYAMWCMPAGPPGCSATPVSFMSHR